jgi:hypothetical protein
LVLLLLLLMLPLLQRHAEHKCLAQLIASVQTACYHLGSGCAASD